MIMFASIGDYRNSRSNSSRDRKDVRSRTRPGTPKTMDFLSASERSRLMSRVKGKDTKPELLVRRLVRQLGFRFRVYNPSLPAHPDLVFPSKRKVIFVHGCFWHRHPHCPKATTPKSRVAFWRKKFQANKSRDRRKLSALRNLGWEALVIWECETRSQDRLRSRIRKYLGEIQG